MVYDGDAFMNTDGGFATSCQPLLTFQKRRLKVFQFMNPSVSYVSVGSVVIRVMDGAIPGMPLACKKVEGFHMSGQNSSASLLTK